MILSAGTVQTPQILMLSGIGNARDLTKHGIAVVHDLPGVGEKLQEHLDITIEYRTTVPTPYGISWRSLPRNIGHVLSWLFGRRGLFSGTTCESGAFVSTVPGVERPDIQLFFCAAIANTQNASGFTGHGVLLHVTDLRPRSIGRLALRSADPKVKPSIIYNFFRGEGTMDALREGFKICRELVKQPAFARHGLTEVSPGLVSVSRCGANAGCATSLRQILNPSRSASIVAPSRKKL